MATDLISERSPVEEAEYREGFALPGSWYYAPQVWEFEKEKIFSRAWQFAGLTSQLENPGDFFTCRAGHIPIVVARDEDGDIHAFVNVCRHRGHQVVPEPAGNRRTLQCRYHAWTYGLDGCLKRAPRSEQDPDFDKRKPDGLLPLKVETWRTVIFVNPDLSAPPLTSVLGEWMASIDASPFKLEEILKPRETRYYQFRSNWKITVENTLECYHCAVCHPRLSQVLDVTQDLWFEEYEWFSVYGTPYKETAVGKDGGDGLYHIEKDDPGGHFSWVWPNLFFSIMPGNAIMTNVMLPDPHDTARSIQYRQFCFPEEMSEKDRRDFMEFFDNVVAEDIPLCESCQRGFETGFYIPGPLMPTSEVGIKHFQRLVHREATRT